MGIVAAMLEERLLTLVRDVSDAESCLKIDGDKLLVPFLWSLGLNRFLLQVVLPMTVGEFPGELMVCERGGENCCTAAMDEVSAEEEGKEIRV